VEREPEVTERIVGIGVQDTKDFKERWQSVDRPSPTIVASVGSRSNRVQVVEVAHDGDRFQGDWRSSALPAPTIRAHQTGGRKGSPGSGWVREAPTDPARLDPAKPPYRIPSMAEIEATEPNGLRLVSTFSGCGGSCLGFRMAGFRVLWANEFIPAAAEVYQANHPRAFLSTEDIRQVTGERIRTEAGIGDEEIDVLEGSPPCASFSLAGRREAHWGETTRYSDTTQRTDDLFDEYVRLLRELRPRAFIAENVSGMVQGKAKGYFLRIARAMRAAGYVVESRLLDAQWLGVPQARRRVIFQGIREDLGRSPAWPRPLPYRYAVRDALADLPNGQSTGTVMRGAIKDPELNVQAVANGVNIERYAIGPEAEKLTEGRSSRRFFDLARADQGRPSPTITALGGWHGAAAVLHPIGVRKFSIPELRRICGFPDDFALSGTFAQQWERLGRAVPPPMMRAVAQALAGVLLDG